MTNQAAKLAHSFSNPSLTGTKRESIEELNAMPEARFMQKQKEILERMQKKCSTAAGRKALRNEMAQYESQPDFVDMASAGQFRDTQVHQANQASLKCIGITIALQKIENGEYSICLDNEGHGCEEEIPRDRLDRNPTSLLCCDCQTKKEKGLPY